ncbi:MAG: methyltransferase [Ignisphaera sp.]
MNNVVIKLSRRVYTPSHDTEILLRTVKHVIIYKKLRTIHIAAEIGSGSGYITAYFLSEGRISYAIMVDIDPYAVYSSWDTLKANNIDDKADVIQCDSLSCIRSNTVEMVYFNPPYLPVCDDIPDAIAWNGGRDGLEVWEKFFAESLRVCKNGCSIIYVFSTLQNLKKMFTYILPCKRIELVTCESFFYETICGVVVECR